MKFLSLLLTGLFMATFSFAQTVDPVKWMFTAKKVAENTFEVHLTASVDASWHIYSQSSPEDGATPTMITFKKNPLVTLQGTPKELGKMVSKYEESFKTTVKYYERTVDFVQLVKVKGKAKTSIAGTIEFMLCNDHECLPGDKIPFTVTLN